MLLNKSRSHEHTYTTHHESPISLPVLLNQLAEPCISLLDALPSRESGPSLCYKDAYGEGLALLPLSAVFILFRKWPSGERPSRRCHARLS